MAIISAVALCFAADTPPAAGSQENEPHVYAVAGDEQLAPAARRFPVGAAATR